ncbi:MAG: DUF2339 domain-containing protein [Vicinamibacteraceae bacterium]
MVDASSYVLLILALFGCLLLVMLTTSGALLRAARALETADRVEHELRALGEQMQRLSERVDLLARQSSASAPGPSAEGSADAPPVSGEEALARAEDDEAWRETVRRMQADTASLPAQTSPAPSEGGPSPSAAAAPGTPLEPLRPGDLTHSSQVSGLASERRGARPSGRGTLERRIAAHWFLYIGIALTAVGGVWLLEYVVSRDWMAAPIRAASGAALGVGLLALGERAARRQPGRGRLLIGMALATLYASAWIIGPGSWLLLRWPAFALLVSVTVLALVESVRHRSLLFALIALATGFATPVLMGPDHVPLALFAYIGALALTARWLAHRRRWPLVDAVAYLLTACVLMWWSQRSYSRDLWWVLQLFLTAYVAMFVIALREAWRARQVDGPVHPWQPWARVALASAPIAYHGASVAILLPHAGGWLVYAIAATLAGLVFAARLGSRTLRGLMFAGIAAPLAVWCYASPHPAWVAAGVVAVAAVSALHVVSEWEALGGPQTTGTEIALSHLNAWWTFLALGLLLAPEFASWPIIVGAPLAVVHAALGAGWWRRYDEAARHHASMALALGATTVTLWTGGFAGTVALALEGVILLSLAQSRAGLRIVGEAVLALAYFSALHTLATRTSLIEPAFFNHRTGPAFVVVAALLVAWWRIGRGEQSRAAELWSTRAALLVGAHLLVVLMLTMEAAVWLQQQALDAAAFEVASEAHAWQTAQRIGPTLLWAAYGCGLVAAGIWRRHAALRYLGVMLAILALGKLCVNDFPAIGPVARLVSALALGTVLLTMAYLYRATKMEST